MLTVCIKEVRNIVDFAINNEPEGIFGIVFGHLGASKCLVGHDLDVCGGFLLGKEERQSKEETRTLRIGKKKEDISTKVTPKENLEVEGKFLCTKGKI